jgi:hypothetical protein
LAACSERIRAAKGNPVTANELLVLLGRAWSRLLIYPGGLAAFGVVWLISVILHRVPSSAAPLPAAGEGSSAFPSPAAGRGVPPQRRGEGSPVFFVLSSVVLPWLALALLPLPLAVALPRQIDIVVALALLEWPNLLAIRQELRTGGVRRLAAALNSYPPLILATLALMQAGNSLELAALARAPGDSAALSTRMLHWLGVIALALALPPALGLGPFADGGRTTNDERRTTNDGGRTTEDERRTSWRSSRSYLVSIQNSVARFFAAGALQIGLRLRALGLVALAALPWAGAEGTGLAPLRMLGAAALIAALLWGADRLMRRQAARRWAWAYLALDAVLLLALLGAAYLELQIRLA